MSSTVYIPQVLNVSGDHSIPQNARRARDLPDSDKWLVAEDDDMVSVEHNKLVVNASIYVHEWGSCWVVYSQEINYWCILY